ncbi:MAG: helix-turn-helix domain-containing protein [Phycisphaerae bacterium]
MQRERGKRNTPERQAAKGVASGEARRQSREGLRAAARLMRAQGMTQQAIADALGVAQQTVSYWLS